MTQKRYRDYEILSVSKEHRYDRETINRGRIIMKNYKHDNDEDINDELYR